MPESTRDYGGKHLLSMPDCDQTRSYGCEVSFLTTRPYKYTHTHNFLHHYNILMAHLSIPELQHSNVLERKIEKKKRNER